jgi:ketosteroid isomerase-like protein
MKVVIQFAVLAFIISPVAYAKVEANRPNQYKKAEQEVLRLEYEQNEAFLRNDAEAIARALADDFIEITARGTIRTKAEMIAEVKSGEVKFDYLKIEEIKVRGYGNTAVVNVRVTSKGRYKGQEFKSNRLWYTRVYVKDHGRWQCVLLQVTIIAP